MPKIGELVFLITDPEQADRMITSITELPNKCYVYTLSHGLTVTQHYDIEFDYTLNKHL